MSFGAGFGRTSEIFWEINNSPKEFYKIISVYFISEKDAIQLIRQRHSIPMMDSRKILSMFKDHYADFRLKEMLENIEEFNPEFAV